jgi:hypothetical protein
VVVVIATVVVVVGAAVDVVVEVVDVVVDVVVVVAGGITKPFAHPHLMSVGAPTGNPTVDGWAFR